MKIYGATDKPQHPRGGWSVTRETEQRTKGRCDGFDRGRAGKEQVG